MFALSPTGGFWIGCAFCPGLAAVTVWVRGESLGERCELERGACEVCAALLLCLELPLDLGGGDRLDQVDVAQTLL